ncbi:hypothetical protein NE237_012976 [Protea cynaroides]|uniref:Uncharacterized protein n=1 Tax=Protea cynaroides TaxID=273540 RepID=A0A9Q0JZQ5_9MAGN|nr:hypothetical protein NE237_012976 [Protea cynaroides]
MVKRPLKYFVVDAFTDTAFKGNPAAVCLLEDEEERDEKWMQAVAAEFNLSETCYLIPISSTLSNANDVSNGHSLRRFHLRWFTPVAEVKLCGHGTLASAHALFASWVPSANVIEFVTLSGVLIAKRVPIVSTSKFSDGEPYDHFSIELDFPSDAVLECESADRPSLSETLNGAPMVNISKTAAAGDIIVELPSGKAVEDLQPQRDEILKCPGRGVIITGPAPDGSAFDFFSRFFCPKFGINEDPVCGSAHCSLVPYWSKRLGKCDLVAYAASPRGGVLDLHLDEATQRVLIRGKAVAVMEGSILA